MQQSHKELFARIAYYKRHKEFDSGLVSKVLKQADEHGAEYVISNISDESRELYTKSREVGCESHRAQGFLRFSEAGEALIAKAEFEHDIIDIVLDHFMKRFPRKKLVIISRGKAYVGERGLVVIEDPFKYNFGDVSIKRAADLDWQAYYDSQYIEARRNRKLAMSHVPKKIWKKFGIAEGNKIDKGIIACKLTSFI